MTEQTNDQMVVINCGKQAVNKFEIEGHIILEQRHFPVNVPVVCSREMGEALIKKHSNPSAAVFFRDANNAQHRVEIQNRNIPNFSNTGKMVKGTAKKKVTTNK